MSLQEAHIRALRENTEAIYKLISILTAGEGHPLYAGCATHRDTEGVDVIQPRQKRQPTRREFYE